MSSGLAKVRRSPLSSLSNLHLNHEDALREAAQTCQNVLNKSRIFDDLLIVVAENELSTINVERMRYSKAVR